MPFFPSCFPSCCLGISRWPPFFLKTWYFCSYDYILYILCIIEFSKYASTKNTASSKNFGFLQDFNAKFSRHTHSKYLTIEFQRFKKSYLHKTGKSFFSLWWGCIFQSNWVHIFFSIPSEYTKKKTTKYTFSFDIQKSGGPTTYTFFASLICGHIAFGRSRAFSPLLFVAHNYAAIDFERRHLNEQKKNFKKLMKKKIAFARLRHCFCDDFFHSSSFISTVQRVNRLDRLQAILYFVYRYFYLVCSKHNGGLEV